MIATLRSTGNFQPASLSDVAQFSADVIRPAETRQAENIVSRFEFIRCRTIIFAPENTAPICPPLPLVPALNPAAS